MKNKVLLILLAVVLAISLVVVGCAPAGPTAPTEIVIGLARDLTAPLAFFECYGAGPVYRWFAAHVNEDVGQAGKIHLSAYDTTSTECWVPIELVVKDFSFVLWDLAAVTQTLIDDGADFIWGGPGTDCIYTQAPVCNAAATLLITLEGGASSLKDDPDKLPNWPYVFMHQSFASWNQTPVLHAMLADEVATPKAYVTYVNGVDGYDYLQQAIIPFLPENILPAGNPPGVAHPLVLTAPMANAIIQAAKAALNATPYDIFCGFTYPWNVYALTQACIDNNFNPPAIIFGPGANFGRYGFDLGYANVEGIMCFATANNKTVPNVGTPTMTMAEMYNAIGDQIELDWADTSINCTQPGGVTEGAQLLDYWGDPCYVAALEMWKYAVEEVGELDSAAIRSALAAFNSTNPAQTVFGDTWYTMFGDGGGILAHRCHTGEIGQWQSGVIEIVGYEDIELEPKTPNYDVTAPFDYPKTGLWGWCPC